MVEKRKKSGRPSTYNEEIATEICKVIAANSIGIRRLCKERAHWPNPDTIFEWRIVHKSFAYQYNLAKQHQTEVLVEEIVDIADDTSNDRKFNSQGEEIVNNEAINRSRLKIDTRKWVAGRLKPKKYGDKIHQESTTTITFSAESRDKIVEAIEKY